MKLYFKYFGIHLRSAMEYKVSFLLSNIAQFIGCFTAFLGICFIFNRFPTIKGYNYNEISICFCIMFISFTISESLFRGFDLFSHIISDGTFDRMLLRPKSLIFQVLTSNIEFKKLGRLLQAICIFTYVIVTSNIIFTIDKIIILVLMIIGGVFIFSGLFIINASFCFYTIEGLEFMNILTDGGREFGKYPLSVYGDIILKFFTYFVPYSLVQYYPFLYLIGKTNSKLYMLLPIVASFFIVPSLVIWKIGVRHYKSIGS